MLLEALQSIQVDTSYPLSGKSPKGAETALLYRAGEWDQAHTVAQNIDDVEGSFWHGILHRQEGDWDNAAYWFRQVGLHAVYPLIRDDAARILTEQPLKKWNFGTTWDPFQFIDLCRETALQPGSPQQQTVIAIQVAEWRRLFDWCRS